ncbi:hypothetical protein MTO96_034067 [Rhipicephalus appendiculatus]
MGYVNGTSIGRGLWQNANEMDLTPTTHKRSRPDSTSQCPRTPRNLAFVRDVEGAEQSKSEINFGSDHYVLETRFNISRSKSREFKATQWSHLRKLCGNDSAHTPRDLEECCERIRSDVEPCTKKILTDQNVGRMDCRLAHLTDAKKAIPIETEVQRKIEEKCIRAQGR